MRELIMMVTLASLAFACTPKQDAAIEEAKTETVNTVQQASNETAGQAQAFKADWDSKIDGLEKKLETLEDQAQTKTSDVKAKMQASIAALKERAETLESEVEKTEGRSKEDWQSFKSSVENQYKDLEAEVNRLTQ